MNIIDDLERADLHAAFEDATESKAIKRLMVALAYTDGVAVDTISGRYGIPRSTVYAWLNRFEEGTIDEAVSDAPRPGRPPALDDAERGLLADALAEPPSRQGFEAERWTPRLVRRYIKRAFDVEYSVGHARRLLREHTGNP